MSDHQLAGVARPFSVGAVLRLTVSTLFGNIIFYTFMGILLVALPIIIGAMLGGLIFAASSSEFLTIILVVPLVFAVLAAIYMMTGAVTHGSYVALRGQSPSIGGSFRIGLRYCLPLLGLLLLYSLGVMLGFMLLVVPGLILLVLWSLVVPVLVIERPSVLSCFSRSLDLTRGYRWHIAGLLLVYFAAAFAVNLVFGITEGVLGAFGLGIVGALLSGLVQLIVSIAFTIGSAVVYFELRRVKEGIDVNEIAAVFD